MHVRCPHCHNPIEFVEHGPAGRFGGDSVSFLRQQLQSGRSGGTTTYDSSGQTIGHFELIEQVGVGAYGAVWKAHDTELDRTVAVKIPRKDQLDAAETEQFFREARAAAQLRHGNIVSVLRSRPRGGAGLHRQRLRPGSQPLRVDADAAVLRPRSGRAVRQDRRSAASCPRGRGHPPGSEALQHHDRPGGPAAHYGFRPRQAGGRARLP